MFFFQTPDKEFLLRISYMEIYNEKVSDLLSTEDKPIRIQEDTVRAMIIEKQFIFTVFQIAVVFFLLMK